MSRIDEYRQRMLASRAAAAGISIDELLRRGERDAAVSRRVVEIRHDRRSAWTTLWRHTRACGRKWYEISGA